MVIGIIGVVLIVTVAATCLATAPVAMPSLAEADETTLARIGKK